MRCAPYSGMRHAPLCILRLPASRLGVNPRRDDEGNAPLRMPNAHAENDSPLRAPDTRAGGGCSARSSPSAASLVVFAAASFGLMGCDKPTEPPICTAIAVDALVVTIVDASSGQRICDATVVAVDGSF